MSRSTPRRTRRPVALLAVTALVAGLGFVLSPAADAAPGPVAQRSATTGVTADPLPTVQVDGIVWSQAVVGNTVYAGGNFANARPAGAAPGTSQTPQSDLIAYNINTGAQITSFSHTFNGQILTVAASPDGTRVYVGGDFTTVDGLNRYRIAAFNTATGALLTSFVPALSAEVKSIVATNSTVYVAGTFGLANSVSRTRLAAFNASNGGLLPWAPTADGVVDAITISPDGSRVAIGGAFAHVNSAPAYGLAMLDPTTGALYPFGAASVVQDGGANAAILSLSISSDGTQLYGTGYVYGSGGNFEGTFAADPDTGNLIWMEDCHGDTYGAFGVNGVTYVVSHEHFCSNVGAFPDTNPRTAWYRSTAFTENVTGTLLTNSEGGYANFAGQPSPSQINWYPNLAIGNVSKAGQAAWSVTGNSNYVVEGGEFPSVNGVGQQGLVRFAVPLLAPNKSGPQVGGTALTPTATVRSNTSVDVSWQADWDRDDQNLTYALYRSDNPSTPVYTTTVTSQFWNRPTIDYLDTGVKPGTAYSYYLKVTDPSGNAATSGSAAVTTTGTAPVNQPPTASFTSSAAKLAVSFDASASHDSDGSVVGYAWDFGDGTTGTGVTPTHTYAASGSYQVTLTVTDDSGATSSATATVAVQAGTTAYASDAFSRTVTKGWGSADVGGAWQISSNAALFSVDGSTGKVNLNAAGVGSTASLPAVSATNTNTVFDSSLNAAATGNGVYIGVSARTAGTSEYRLKLRYLPGGVVHLVLTKLVGGQETALKEVAISGLTYTTGAILRTRFVVTGNGSSTTLTGSVWTAGGTEPASPQISATDTTATLQGAGSVSVEPYLSGSATTVPVVVSLDNFSVTPG